MLKGIWSLSNEELLADKEFHDAVNTYAGWLGGGLYRQLAQKM